MGGLPRHALLLLLRMQRHQPRHPVDEHPQLGAHMPLGWVGHVQRHGRQAFSNLNAVLQAAGCTFDDVVDVTMFVVDPEAHLETVWSVVPEFWGEAPHPALTGMGVTWLSGFQFEIKVIAKLPDTEIQHAERPQRKGA